jgi:predicted O-methyltransferase YrrM
LDFLDPALEAYSTAHTSPESDALHKLNRETHLKVLQARMLSGHLQGRVLSMLSHMVRPKSILEIGTYTGYSAICLAEGLAEGGHLHTIDINEELEPMVKKYLSLTGNTSRVSFHIGHALELIHTIEGSFDMVFIDADKTNYLPYYEAIFKRVTQGGYIIADNVLWSGKVLDEKEIKNDPETAALAAFNIHVINDDRVENVLLPLRDGIMIARKVKD